MEKLKLAYATIGILAILAVPIFFSDVALEMLEDTPDDTQQEETVSSNDAIQQQSSSIATP